jgi:hypothetical protein
MLKILRNITKNCKNIQKNAKKHKRNCKKERTFPLIYPPKAAFPQKGTKKRPLFHLFYPPKEENEPNLPLRNTQYDIRNTRLFICKTNPNWKLTLRRSRSSGAPGKPIPIHSLIYSFTHLLRNLSAKGGPNYAKRTQYGKIRFTLHERSFPAVFVEGKNAKRTQFQPARYEPRETSDEICKTNPIEYRASRICKTNPILQISRIEHREYAKRTQFNKEMNVSAALTRVYGNIRGCP